MELWDIYDINRNKTGKTIDRHSSEKIKDGEYHLVVEIMIINSKKQILLSKRSKLKQKYPLMWEFCGGSAIKGENSQEAIIREVKEELGLKVKKEQLIFYKTLRDDKAKDFKDIWLIQRDFLIKDLNFMDKEVIDAKWVDMDEFNLMLQKNEIVPTIDFKDEDYNQCLKLLQ